MTGLSLQQDRIPFYLVQKDPGTMQEDFASLHRITEAPAAGTSALGTSLRQQQQQSNDLKAASVSSKLEPYLVLAKSARGDGAAGIVVDQVTAANGVYTFGELLDVKAISDLESSQSHRGKWLLLQVFAFGTLQDYRANAVSLSQLSPAQLSKLRLLTLVDLASKHQMLSYAQLLPALELSSIRQLEDLIIEALYADLLKARINQKRQVLEVDSVIGRDVKTQSSSLNLSFGAEKTVAALLENLGAWYQRVDDTLSELDLHVQTIRQKESEKAQQASAQSQEVRNKLEEVRRNALSKEKNSKDTVHTVNNPPWNTTGWQHRSPGVVIDDEAMAVDERSNKLRSPGKGANRKRSRA